jgi:hypothetical protein
MIRPPIHRRKRPRPWLAFALCLAALLAGCGDSLRAHVGAVSNTVAVGADHGREALLAAYCAASMRALGRGGDYHNGTCSPTGPDAEREATDDERAALVVVRTAWRPALIAHEALARAQRGLADVLAAGDAIDADAALIAVGQLVSAYREVSAGARALGVQLPELTGVTR